MSTRDPYADRGSSGRQHPLARLMAEKYGLDFPGFGMALFEMAGLIDLGIEVTPELLDKIMQKNARSATHLDEYQQRQANDHQRKAVVYYMRLGNRCKIGTSINLTKRTESIRPEEVLATEPGSVKVERMRHEQFKDLRVVGEWFRYEGALVEHVASLRRRAEDRPA